MLTPLDIKNKTFKGSIGYNKKDVDAFMVNVLNSYETLYKTNKDLDEKNNVLASNLASYKTIEKQLEKSLVLAQKTAEDVRAQAKREAENIEAKARLDAARIIEDAKNELAAIEKQIDELVLNYEKYKSQIRSLAFAQIELMDNTAFQFENPVKSVVNDLMKKDFSDALDEVAVSDEDIANEITFDGNFEEKN